MRWGSEFLRHSDQELINAELGVLRRQDIDNEPYQRGNGDICMAGRPLGVSMPQIEEPTIFLEQVLIFFFINYGNRPEILDRRKYTMEP